MPAVTHLPQHLPRRLADGQIGRRAALPRRDRQGLGAVVRACGEDGDVDVASQPIRLPFTWPASWDGERLLVRISTNGTMKPPRIGPTTHDPMSAITTSARVTRRHNERARARARIIAALMTSVGDPYPDVRRRQDESREFPDPRDDQGRWRRLRSRDRQSTCRCSASISSCRAGSGAGTAQAGHLPRRRPGLRVRPGPARLVLTRTRSASRKGAHAS